MWGIVVRTMVFAAALSCGTGAARAERLLVLPAGGTESAAREAERLVAQLVTELERRGHEVRRAGSREAELAEGLLGCDTSACARSGLEALGVAVLVAPALWSGSGAGSGEPREFALSVVGASGSPLDLRESMARGAEGAAIVALAAALDERLEALAQVPEARAVEPATLRAPEVRARSGWNVGLGLGLTIVGAAPLAIAATTWARDGACVRPDADGICRYDDEGRYEVYDFGPRSVVLLGAGAAAVGTGLVFLVVRPLRVRPAADVSPVGAGLRLVGSF